MRGPAQPSCLADAIGLQGCVPVQFTANTGTLPGAAAAPLRLVALRPQLGADGRRHRAHQRSVKGGGQRDGLQAGRAWRSTVCGWARQGSQVDTGGYAISATAFLQCMAQPPASTQVPSRACHPTCGNMVAPCWSVTTAPCPHSAHQAKGCTHSRRPLESDRLMAGEDVDMRLSFSCTVSSCSRRSMSLRIRLCGWQCISSAAPAAAPPATASPAIAARSSADAAAANTASAPALVAVDTASTRGSTV